MAEKLPRSLLYTYGIADLTFALMINMEAYFFTAFLTDHAQFSLIIAGQILALTGLVDIVCSLVGGLILQKTNLKLGGKYRSWFLVGPPIVVPLFVLQFTKIGNDLTAASIIAMGFIASHLLFNVVVSASGAMVGRLGGSSAERTVLSASRAQGMAAAGLIFSATAMPLIHFFSARTDTVLGYTSTVAVFAILMMLGYWYIFKMTAGRDPYDETTESVDGSGPGVINIVGLVFKNPPLLFLILASTFSSTGFFIITTLAIYYFTYVTRNPAFLSVFILAISVARLIGTLAAPWIGVKIGKRNSYWIFLGLAAAGFASAKLLQGTAWGYALAFSICILLASIATSMNTALYSDTVVYGEWKTGNNIRAFTMALMNLPIKVGVLARSGIVTAGLIAIGFEANADPTPGVAGGISSIMTFATAASYLLAAAIFFFGYRIEEKQVLQMQEEITARRAAVQIL